MGFSSQEAVMVSAHLPPRNGWNEPALSAEPGLWGPLKGLEE